METLQGLTLEQVKDSIQAQVKEIGAELVIENIWLDFGAGISGDNIIANNVDQSSYQLLSMGELSHIKMGVFTQADVQRVVDRMLARGW